MKKWMIGIMAMALTMGFRPDGYVQAQADTDAAFVDEDGDGIDDTDRMRHRMGRRGFLGRGLHLQLDETQRDELKALVDGLRESDSTREEIRAAVDAKLDEWGVERLDPSDRPDRRGRHPALSEAQRDELKALIDGLRESDSTREEIRTAVEAKLDGWGVERPERGEHRTGPGRFGRRGDFRGFRGPHHGPPPASAGETESSGS